MADEAGLAPLHAASGEPASWAIALDWGLAAAVSGGGKRRIAALLAAHRSLITPSGSSVR